jgi:hypothetical protein
MKRARIITLLTLVVVLVALALPGMARADESTDGWTWDEAAVTQSEPAPDGWTWDSESTQPSPDPAPADPSPDGWTWDEETVPAGG